MFQERAKSNTFDEAVFQSLPSMWKRQMKHFEFHAQCVLRFAKKVPGIFAAFSLHWFSMFVLKLK